MGYFNKRDQNGYTFVMDRPGFYRIRFETNKKAKYHIYKL